MNTMRAFPGGLPNLHIAVVTSDLGAGPDRESPLHARRQGRRVPHVARRLHGPDRLVHRRVEQRSDQELSRDDRRGVRVHRERRDVGLRPRAPARVAGGGARLLRVDRRRRIAGFLRPDAFLAVAFITNEDDCSAPPDTTLFDLRRRRRAARSVPFIFRCNEFGHLCGGVAPPRNGDHAGDRSPPTAVRTSPGPPLPGGDLRRPSSSR